MTEPGPRRNPRVSPAGPTGLLALALLGLVAAGCADHPGIPAAVSTNPVVFADDYGAYVVYQPFMGSKSDAVVLDSSVTHSGARSMRVTVPGPGDAGGTYAGGAFTTGRARDLSGYDALVFWARADHAITLDVAGLGNDNTGHSLYEARWTSIPIGTDWARYAIPIPLPSRLVEEQGLFFFAEGPEMGQGATLWIDDLAFQALGTVTNPRPVISTVTLHPDVGSYVSVPGTRVTFAVDGADRTVDAMQGYFTFVSSADSVALGGEGTVQVVGLGTATITALLGSVPATGVITLATNPSPQSAAPTPSVPAADVISLFSNAYTNVPVDTWSAGWDQADVADVQVAGNDTKKYTSLVYAGIEFTGTHVVDATTMTHLHLDVWAATGTSFKVKLVDFGANGSYGGGDDREHELTFTAATTPAFTAGAWSSLEIPLSSFVNLTTRAHLAQMILGGNTGTAYVDNLYFHR